MVEAACIGWDIGGAHLKVAAVDSAGRPMLALQRPCTLWRGLDHLERALDEAMRDLPGAAANARHAATMTGELVDLFADRHTGVRAIASVLHGRMPALRLFAGTRGFVDPLQAAQFAGEIASANWCATAQLLAGRLDAALLVDIGSTTTDLVAVAGGRLAARGRSDFERLVAGELVYTGVVRTPLMAVAESIAIGPVRVPTMAEHFATTADVYRLTGELDERCDQHPAADGGEKTAAASARRLARMIGRDAIDAPLSQWQALAREFRWAQLERIGRGARQVLGDAALPASAPMVAAGSGAFLVADLARALGRAPLGFADLLDARMDDPSMLSVCAPAVAVAILALADPR